MGGIKHRLGILELEHTAWSWILSGSSFQVVMFVYNQQCTWIFRNVFMLAFLTSKCWRAFLYNCELRNWGVKCESCGILKNFENVRAETFNL